MGITVEFVTDHLVIWLMYSIRDILSIDAKSNDQNNPLTAKT
jgi:hypothetical protein